MFVKKTTYDAVIQSLESLREEKSHADSLLEQLQTQNDDLKQQIAMFKTSACNCNTSDLQQELKNAQIALQQTQNSLMEKDQKVISLAHDRQNALAQVETLRQQNADLLLTIERLNQTVPTPTTVAPTTNDSVVDPASSLNNYITENMDDTTACIDMIKKSGLFTKKK